MLAYIDRDTPSWLARRVYTDPTGVQHDVQALEAAWSDADLRAIGLYRVSRHPPEPGREIVTWVLDYDGEAVVEAAVYAPQLSPQEAASHLKNACRLVVQDHIDLIARAREYIDGFALASYATSTVPLWRGEAEAFIAWRDAVWLVVFDLLAQVEAGTADPPETPDALVAMLPHITWPTA